MPGAGTDHTRDIPVRPGPVIILVEPQMPENIGAAARAMGNFGLSELRVVKPRDVFPHAKSRAMASGADAILDRAIVFSTLAEAIADLGFVAATTARTHDQVKPVFGADSCAAEMAPRVAAGERVGIVFGRERNGLENPEVALCDAILTLPVNPSFASLNLAQAVVVCAYEWFKLTSGNALPFEAVVRSEPATKGQMEAFFDILLRELDAADFFRPPEKKAVMQINLRNIVQRMAPSKNDMQILHGVVASLTEGRKGPVRGGGLTVEQVERVKDLVGDLALGPGSGQAPLKGLSRLLRRHPSSALKLLWSAFPKDRRFANLGFKRQEPVGPHVPDLVSFARRQVVEIVPADEGEGQRAERLARGAWLIQRGYQVEVIEAQLVETDVGAALDALAGALLTS
jgi:tRNA/rRNA methyltransferase